MADESTRTASGHPIASRGEWRAARLALLEQEKELTKRSDELARQRAALPWVPVDKDYTFATEAGDATLDGLFSGRSQLIVYHLMFGPDWTEGCPSCSAIADGFEGIRAHLEDHDVSLVAISRAPLDRLLAYRDRMGWTFPWASSLGSDFNYDFHVTDRSRCGAGRIQLPGPGRARGARRQLEGLVRRAAGHERVRPRRRQGVPRLLCLRPWPRCALGGVPVARPGAARPQRGRLLVAAARPVRPVTSVSSRPAGWRRGRNRQPAGHRHTVLIVTTRSWPGGFWGHRGHFGSRSAPN